jgi:hypothetical protein
MTIEINSNFKPQNCQVTTPAGGKIMFTPPLNANYFIARVPLFQDQAIVLFPKFGTIGCGFAVEEKSWNTNLPIACPAEEIFKHILKNKKYEEITEPDIKDAIVMLQAWALQHGLITPIDMGKQL